MASRVATRREHTGNRQLDAMQRTASRIGQRAERCPFISGVLRSVTLATATPKVVNHGLGERAAFMVVRPNYDGTGGTSSLAQASNQEGLDPANQLAVVADAACTVDLWFYPVASEAVPR